MWRKIELGGPAATSTANSNSRSRRDHSFAGPDSVLTPAPGYHVSTAKLNIVHDGKMMRVSGILVGFPAWAPQSQANGMSTVPLHSTLAYPSYTSGGMS